MYKRLLGLVNNFIYVERALFGQKLYCKLVDVTEDTLEIQTYDRQGNEEARVILPMATVTGIATQSAEIDRLALRVKWAQSPDEPLPSVRCETPSHD